MAGQIVKEELIMQPVQQSNEPVRPAQPAQPVQPVQPAPSRVQSTSVSAADRVAQAIYVLFGILEGLIAIRILLKLFAANPDAAFTAFVYNITSPFVAPFLYVFPTPAIHGSVFEFSALLALIVYALLGWGIVRLVQTLGQRQTTTASP
jgi:uncharacterized protein YggT (Ycf19 family)